MTAEHENHEDVYARCARDGCSHQAINHTSGPRGFVYGCAVEGCGCRWFQATNALGWHVVAGEDLLALLRRAAGGEDPDLLYTEAWANAQHEGA